MAGEGEIKSKFRGNNIELQNDSWVFSDTKEKVSETWEKRPCGHCNKMNTPEGYDGCMGYIPNAINACCGHGNINEAYIQFEDKTIRGVEVSEYLKESKPLSCIVQFETKPIDDALKNLESAIGNIKITVN